MTLLRIWMGQTSEASRKAGVSPHSEGHPAGQRSHCWGQRPGSQRAGVRWLLKQEGKRISTGETKAGEHLTLTELGFSPMFASTYVSVLGSTASSASRIFSTGMSSLALLVDSTSFSFRSLPRCRSSCTAVNRRQSPGLARHPPHAQGQPNTCLALATGWLYTLNTLS